MEEKMVEDWWNWANDKGKWPTMMEVVGFFNSYGYRTVKLGDSIEMVPYVVEDEIKAT